MTGRKTSKTDLRTLVVAGCSSGAGKTLVAESLTRVLARSCRTAAVKITVTHGERGCPHGGKGCNVCSSLGGEYQIIVADSVISQPGTDTARLKSAGGSPIVWIITKDYAIGSAWEETRSHFSEVECVVVESNTLAEYIEPTLTVMVVDPSVSRKIWKPSAERLIASADYVVFNDRGDNAQRQALWKELKSLRGDLTKVIRALHPSKIIESQQLMHNLQLISEELIVR